MKNLILSLLILIFLSACKKECTPQLPGTNWIDEISGKTLNFQDSTMLESCLNDDCKTFIYSYQPPYLIFSNQIWTVLSLDCKELKAQTSSGEQLTYTRD